jgi:hypothetical protein
MFSPLASIDPDAILSASSSFNKHKSTELQNKLDFLSASIFSKNHGVSLNSTHIIGIEIFDSIIDVAIFHYPELSM